MTMIFIMVQGAKLGPKVTPSIRLDRLVEK
jgi:hypothetical protein